MADCDDPRQVRLAQALRANLRRRKAAEREAGQQPPPGPEPDLSPSRPPPERD